MIGTKYSCGIGLCGACTVLVNGEATCSCSISVASGLDKKINTIEHSEPNSSLFYGIVWSCQSIFHV
ncbi:MAG: 2Fe-2S iron-sulfur cluster-binding protein [Flavobacteriaceae bacterium]